MHSIVYNYIELCKDKAFTGIDDPRVIQGVHLSDSEEAYVCFTFDDGPTSNYTPQILDILNKHQAKATFFIFGRFATEHPEIIRRIAKEGHELGNHTYSHPDLTSLDFAAIEREILEAEQAIQSIVDYRCKLFRPPYGIFSPETVGVVESLHYKFALWSRDVQAYDWELPGVDKMVEEVLSHVRSGSIILLHDAGGNREQTVELVDWVIPILKSRNYHFITMSELLAQSV